MTKGDLTLVHQNNIKICTFEEKKKKLKEVVSSKGNKVVKNHGKYKEMFNRNINNVDNTFFFCV